MKKQITSSVLKSIFSAAILVSVLFVNTARAAEDKSGKVANYELRYIGKTEGQPIFQLDIANLQKEDVYITLQDEVGNNLYTDKFSENFSKKFQFDISEGSASIRMTLISKGLRKTQVFKINSVDELVQKVVVTKVK